MPILQILAHTLKIGDYFTLVTHMSVCDDVLRIQSESTIDPV